MNEDKKQLPVGTILSQSWTKGVNSGLSGATAMGINVLTLLWLRTTINYQYRNGTTTTQAFKTLYQAGGIRRFYSGLGPALLQAPLSRFGDTFANGFAMNLLGNYRKFDSYTSFKTACAAIVAALFRITLMPIDTFKTTMQVQGSTGFSSVIQKVRVNGFTVLYHGALAASLATFVGYYPWFYTYNKLQNLVPQQDHAFLKLLRQGCIGFCCSAISDSCSNSIRVLKVYRQSATETVGYMQSVKEIIEKEGYVSLFGRGLKTKILSNGVQGFTFSVLWRYIENFNKPEKKAN